jgi:hypothetical protein
MNLNGFGWLSRYSDGPRAGRPGFDSRNRLLCTPQRSDRLWSPPIQWVPGAVSPEVKRPSREADHSPPSSTEVKNGGAVPQFLYTSSWHRANYKGSALKIFPQLLANLDWRAIGNRVLSVYLTARTRQRKSCKATVIILKSRTIFSWVCISSWRTRWPILTIHWKAVLRTDSSTGWF